MIDAWFLTDARVGGVMARADRLLTLDTDMAVGAESYAELRDRRGRAWGPVKVTAPDPQHPNRIELDAADLATVEDFYDQPLSDVLAADQEDMTTVRVGTLAELQDPYLIQSVEPSARDSIKIKSVRDAPEVFDALGEALPPEPPLPSVVDLTPSAYPAVPWVRAHCVQKGLSLVMEWACGIARRAASYIVLLSYDDGDTYETVSTGSANSGSYTLRHVEGQEVKVLAYALDAAGAPGPPVETSFFTSRPIVVEPDIVCGTREWITEQIGAELADLRQQIRDISLSIADTSDRNWSDKKLVRSDIVASEGRATAAVSVVSTALAASDAAFAAYQVTVTAQFGNVDSSILNESTARASADSALSASITSLSSTVTTNYNTLNSAITSEVTTRANADTAIAADVSSLSATVTINYNTLNSAITSESVTRSNADSALSATITSISATVTSNYNTLNAAVSSEATTRANNDSAISATVTTVSAVASRQRVWSQNTAPTAGGVGDIWLDTGNGNVLKYWNGSAWVTLQDSGIAANAAAISSEAVARADADSALSSSYNSLSTIVSGHTSILTTYGTSINGLLVEYGITGTIDGVTGHFIFGGVKKNDGSVSYLVDITGDVVVHGTLKTEHLEVGSMSGITTATAADGNATISPANYGTYTSFTGSQTLTINSVAFSVVTGTVSIALGLSTYFGFTSSEYGDTGFFFNFALVVDSTVIKTWSIKPSGIGLDGNGNLWYVISSQHFKEAVVTGLSAGNHTAYVKVTLPTTVNYTNSFNLPVAGGKSITIPVNDRTLKVTELKRQEILT
jgi:hypothetical protein